MPRIVTRQNVGGETSTSGRATRASADVKFELLAWFLPINGGQDQVSECYFPVQLGNYQHCLHVRKDMLV